MDLVKTPDSADSTALLEGTGIRSDAPASMPAPAAKVVVAGTLTRSSSVPPAKFSKEVVLNDVTNSGVISALVGGFALSNVQNLDLSHTESDLHEVNYILLYFAVHSCTCSALTSAILYRTLNLMSEDAVAVWCERRISQRILAMPMIKFVLGATAYIISVICMAMIDLADTPFYRTLALIIGIASPATVAMTYLML